MRLLLHICCAPCSAASLLSLRDEGFEVHGFWHNPNIHPYTEYKNRRDTLAAFAREADLPLALQDAYGLREFLTHTWPEPPEGRCAVCYELRMEAAAAYAAEHGFAAFTTTLLISPYQKHDALRGAAERAAGRHGVSFLYRDFRPLFRESQKLARDKGLYLQKYCGCIFSEEERYGVMYKSI